MKENIENIEKHRKNDLEIEENERDLENLK